MNSRTLAAESFEIVPDTSLLTKMSRAGYSISQSISEFVDNSLDARIPGTQLTVEIGVMPNRIEIRDNGTGMTKQQLKDAITLGRSTKKDQLGEYGLGLKTASLCLGGRLEVITTTSSDANYFRTVLDEDEWREKKKWEITIETIVKGAETEQGTLISISKPKLRPDKHIAQLRMDLGLRFGPFISEKELVLAVNGKNCVWRRPDIDNSTKKPFDISVKNGRIHGWYALLKKGSQRGMYGFNTYRRGRLITTFDKIGFDPHPTVARLIGEIHMDHVPVTTSKREWIKESDEYSEAETALEKELADILKQARAKSSEEKVNKHVKERLEILKEGIYDALRSPEITSFDKPEANVGSIPTENSEVGGLIETRNPPMRSDSHNKQPETEKTRLPKKIQNPKRNIVRIKGKRFEFEHYYSPLGEEARSYEYKVNEKSRIVSIYTNTLFPAFNTTNDQAFYAFMHIVDSLSELFLVYSGEPRERYDEVRDTMLRKASEYVEDLTRSKKE